VRQKSIVKLRVMVSLAGCIVAGSALAVALVPDCWAQSSSSSSAPAGSRAQDTTPLARPRAAQIEEGGAAVTLEDSEPLFDLAAALNACGYDADLDKSAPVRAKVRADMNETLQASEEARASRDALCGYITKHHANDMGIDVGQYVSLALYLSPPPELTPNVSELDLPPQAAAVVNVLPLLRAFVAAVNLHLIWVQHRAEYEALLHRVHDPMTQMILGTNIYLHQPVSSYDGRRFLVLIEPMLSPNLTNARIYGTDYITVTSPDNRPDGDPVRMDEIRHIYLHYIVEPLVYSRSSAMERIQPMLRGVQDAPLEFFYKSDVEALLSECLIKAIEARNFAIAAPAPHKPAVIRSRADSEPYEAAMAAYNSETALERLLLVDSDERQGWTLTGYFYRALELMEKTGDGLRDEIAPMIYGMDVGGEEQHARRIQFVKEVPSDPLHPSHQQRTLAAMDLAEFDLMKGDADSAATLAEKEMVAPSGDHGHAQYILARIDLMHGEPEKAQEGFESTLRLSKDPRTLAWSHIYLGRLYDMMSPPDRNRAIAEYKTALQVRDSRPDTKIAADAGIARPFAPPTKPAQTGPKPADDEKDFDPTGKKEKEQYKPPQ
jgi:tetratricopeptide (TPR) repeat protein